MAQAGPKALKSRGDDYECAQRPIHNHLLTTCDNDPSSDLVSFCGKLWTTFAGFGRPGIQVGWPQIVGGRQKNGSDSSWALWPVDVLGLSG